MEPLTLTLSVVALVWSLIANVRTDRLRDEMVRMSRYVKFPRNRPSQWNH